MKGELLWLLNKRCYFFHHWSINNLPGLPSSPGHLPPTLSIVWTINPYTQSLTLDFTCSLPLCNQVSSFLFSNSTHICISPFLATFPSAGSLPRTQPCHLSRKMMILLSSVLDVESYSWSSSVKVSQKIKNPKQNNNKTNKQIPKLNNQWKKVFFCLTLEIRYF